MPFTDRADAGRRLAARLADYRSPDVVVLGLPRGGVPVAFVVAAALHAPLDVLVVRKLGVPFEPELAMGAIGEGGVRVLNEQVLADAEITDVQLAAVEASQREVLDQRVAHLRKGVPPASLEGRTALIIDDGIATGATARAACQVARARGAARVILAAPVAPPHRIPALEEVADEVICLETPVAFYAIGHFYDDFSEVSEAEVATLLAMGAATPHGT